MPKPTLARELHFASLDDILADARQIAQHPDAPTRGNWSPAGQVWHVTKYIHASVEGYPFQVPLFFRLVGPLMKKSMVNKPMKPGINLPGKIASVVVPAPDLTMDEAMDYLETWVGKTKTDGFLLSNPMLGKMTQDQWVGLHCRHAEMHFGLIELPS